MKLNIRISFQYLLELVSFFFFFLWNNDFFIWNIHSLQIFIAQRWNMVLVRKNWHESGRHKVPISDVISRLTFKTENFVNMSHEVCMVRAIERQRRRRPRSTFHHIDAACDQKLIKVFSIRRDLKLVIYTRIPEERKWRAGS